jgi:hypothetical protein
MREKSNYLSAALIGLLLISCSSETSTSEPQEIPLETTNEAGIKDYKPITGKKADAVFLCDFTTSLDTSGWSVIIKNQIAAAEQLCDGSRIRIYGIDATTYNNSVFEGTLPIPEGTLKAHIGKYKRKKNEFIDGMKNALEQAKNQAMKADKKTQSISCITVSLRKGYDLLRNTNKSLYESHLFVFSDMIEQCDQTGGKVNFCTSSYAASNKQITQNFHPDFQLEPVFGSHLYFIITPTILNCKLSDHDLRSLWFTILEAHGYTKAEAQKIHFDSSVPALR